MKKLINKIRRLLGIKKFIGSSVATHYVGREDIRKCYATLVMKYNIKITSVSVTRVVTDLSPMPIDMYMVIVSYDLYRDYEA